MNGRGPTTWLTTEPSPEMILQVTWNSKKLVVCFLLFQRGIFRIQPFVFGGVNHQQNPQVQRVFDRERILGESIPNLILYTVGVRLDV